METNWYIARDRKKQGPFSLAQMQQMAGNGQLLPIDMVLQEGTAKWIAASQVEAFFPQPQTAPPPPPVPVVEAPEWHFSQRGSQSGPVTLSRLKEMAGAGTLRPADLVWKAGMPAWVAASSVQGLFPPPKVQQTPPPLPKSVTPPALSAVTTPTEVAVPSQPTVSGKVTIEIIMEPYTGPVTPGKKNEVDVYLDGNKCPWNQTICLEDGFRIYGPTIRASTGVHSIKLGPATGVMKKLFNMFSKSKEPSLPPLPEQVYRVEFKEPGHYEVKFRFEEPRTNRAFPVEAIPVKVRDLRPGLFARIGKAWSDSEESSRREKLKTLWKPVAAQGMWFMFTHDDAMLREDGLATKFRWLDNETIELYDSGCDATVKMQVLSLGENELILKAGQQSGHFFSTDTITQAEKKRQQEKADQARAEFNAKAVQVAGTVAAVLAIGGLAVLCGVAALAVGGGAAGGGGSGSSGGEDVSLSDSKATTPQSSSLGTGPTSKSTPEKPRQVAAVCGAVIVSSTGRDFSYKKRCDCGHVEPGQINSSIPTAGSTINTSFCCSKCSRMQEVRIQGG